MCDHNMLVCTCITCICIQVVPLDLKSDEQELKAFNVRMDDLYAIDLTFVRGFDQPTLAYLAEVRLCIHVPADSLIINLGTGLSITLKAGGILLAVLWGAVAQWPEHLQLKLIPWVQSRVAFFSLPAGLLM